VTCAAWAGLSHAAGDGNILYKYGAMMGLWLATKSQISLKKDLLWYYS
jgi:hypothetical protein